MRRRGLLIKELGERGAEEAERRPPIKTALTKDYMTRYDIAKIESVLTMVGGKIVYAAAPFAKLERK